MMMLKKKDRKNTQSMESCKRFRRLQRWRYDTLVTKASGEEASTVSWKGHSSLSLSSFPFLRGEGERTRLPVFCSTGELSAALVVSSFSSQAAPGDVW